MPEGWRPRILAWFPRDIREWLSQVKPEEEKALYAAFLGWAAASTFIHMLFSGPRLSIVGWALWASVFGGFFFGRLADRIGRPPTLALAMAWMAFAFMLAAHNPTSRRLRQHKSKDHSGGAPGRLAAGRYACPHMR